MQIQGGPYLQYFCRLPKYRDELSFDGSTIVRFRKRLTTEIL
ncbi:MAG: transposase [Clostridia bacterium]|nr:transposase [Clostridia bacterium]